MTNTKERITVKNTYLSATPKNVIINLPGFEDDKYLRYSVKDLRQELKNFMRDHKHSKHKAWNLVDYIDLYNKIPQAPKQLKPLPKYIDSKEYKSRQQQKHDKELFKQKQQHKFSDDTTIKHQHNNDDELFNKIIPSVKDMSYRQQFIVSEHKQNLIYDELKILNIPITDDIVKQYKERVNKVKDHHQFKQRLTTWMNLAKNNRMNLNGKIKYFTLNNPVANIILN